MACNAYQEVMTDRQALALAVLALDEVARMAPDYLGTELTAARLHLESRLAELHPPSRREPEPVMRSPTLRPLT